MSLRGIKAFANFQYGLLVEGAIVDVSILELQGVALLEVYAYVRRVVMTAMEVRGLEKPKSELDALVEHIVWEFAYDPETLCKLIFASDLEIWQVVTGRVEASIHPASGPAKALQDRVNVKLELAAELLGRLRLLGTEVDALKHLRATSGVALRDSLASSYLLALETTLDEKPIRSWTPELRLFVEVEIRMRRMRAAAHIGGLTEIEGYRRLTRFLFVCMRRGADSRRR